MGGWQHALDDSVPDFFHLPASRLTSTVTRVGCLNYETQHMGTERSESYR